MFSCVLLLSHMVSWVRYGTRLYRFLIFAEVRRYIFQKLLLAWIFFLIKQNLLFYHGDGCLWPHCCMNKLYISHRSLYAPTYSFEQSTACLSVVFELLPGFIPFAILWHAGWTLEKNIYINMNYNYLTTICECIFAHLYKFLVEQYIFPIFAYKCFKVKSRNCK